MPTIDADTGSLTLRIVYDGLPLAGKTTSVRTLAKRMRGTRGFTSPAEAEGRTLYFDWLEFAGGDYAGKEILVQITSVPGQLEYRERRQHLLDRADAIVFVADTRRSALAESLELFSEVARSAKHEHPALGVVFQANKRDAPDSVPLEHLRTALSRFGRVSLVDTIATAGDGVAEAFAIATRLALDRTHVLATEGRLPVSSTLVRSPSELLAHLQGLERSATALLQRAQNHSDDAKTENGRDRVSSGEVAARDEVVFTPDVRLPAGHIWPPVEGRALVLEAAQSGVVATRSGAGDWWASTAGWRFHSDRQASFSDVNSARSHLVDWARRHASCGAFLSVDRVLLVTGAAGGTHRLWQLVRVAPSLREMFLGELPPAEEFTARLFDAAQSLWRARETMAELGVSLRCSLWTIGEAPAGAPVFVGLMPSGRESGRPELAGSELLERELLPIARSYVATGRMREVLERFEAMEGRLASTLSRIVASLLRRSNGHG